MLPVPDMLEWGTAALNRMGLYTSTGPLLPSVPQWLPPPHLSGPEGWLGQSAPAHGVQVGVHKQQAWLPNYCKSHAVNQSKGRAPAVQHA
jgi:hypothetical protein